MKKITFDIIFILLSGALILALDYYEILEKYMAFSLIPILTAYQLGKYSERKFRNDGKE